MQRVRDDCVPPAIEGEPETPVRVGSLQKGSQGGRRRQAGRAVHTEVTAVPVSRIGRHQAGRFHGGGASLVRSLGFAAGPGIDQNDDGRSAAYAGTNRSAVEPHADRSTGAGEGAVFPSALAANGSRGESLQGRQALSGIYSRDHRRPAHVVGCLSRRRRLDRFIGLSPTAPGGLPLRQRQVGKVLRRGNKHSGRLREGGVRSKTTVRRGDTSVSAGGFLLSEVHLTDSPRRVPDAEHRRARAQTAADGHDVQGRGLRAEPDDARKGGAAHAFTGLPDLSFGHQSARLQPGTIRRGGTVSDQRGRPAH